MPTVPEFDMYGNRLGTLHLNDDVFGLPANDALLHQAVVRHLANQRAGTADTKTRSEVSGGGKKPWRQKGTGRARHGSTRSPIWRKGGVVWGPHPRSYQQSLNKKMRTLAIKTALSEKVRSYSLTVLDSLVLDTFSTRQFLTIFDAITRFSAAECVSSSGLRMNLFQSSMKTTHSDSLIVLDAPNIMVQRSARNVPYVKVVPWSDLNVYDVLKYRRLVFTGAAVAAMEAACQ